MQYDENAEKYGYEGEMTPMKCDELEAYGMDDPAIGEEYEMYKVADVDELLSEKNEEIYNIKYSRDEWAKACNQKDKEIAELKAQKAQAEDDCAYWKMNERNAVNAMHETEEYAMQLYNESRHSKYKRCLANANYWVAISYHCVDDKHRKKAEKHHYKWLELAEKFKEAK